ncbi:MULTISPECIES: ubiquinol oxidase subunit II [Rhizobium]|uniref:Ubiquinol oxidase polypeptide II n=1 Tax=Rhizobium leguminosarum TaxID=384 RepID=A0A444IHN7_RHILE|nr:ubiquinol oxidase subunit II [Rhizobium leguminosarum]ASS59526.1 ubiquinol oxidase subunit II [Rhizobium leguminosarum bv. viciae]AVC47418.1 ubiquinol oxidase, subunit II [Rhizobium leguminosarum bv. viciae]MBY5465167.1 ubiquinol oxidase subunit II [Rhizobium leguminosarum]MBY5479988.1 ubiquinol oxidase subunit II [Rhizobium leguminosarum]MBY5486767.1 ubiquinol oxidase subunit II [Rhizobium leguminosarum]
MPKLAKFSRLLSVLPLLFLAGCNMVVMAPSGDIAMQQRDLIVISTVLMLLIIVPVIFLTLFFAWRYRRSNTVATYAPEWHHSTRLEIVIWAAPLAIIIALGAVTWISTHKLDPYRPLDRLDAERAIPADTKPLNVEVVALDWKWLFFYPELGIATVNELAAPVDMPINFKITASSVMNSFYIPALAGQIYAMPGMETKLHAVINKEGEYEGFSANYSGAGFSHMRFKFHGLTQEGFDAWVAQVKQQGTMLNRDAYLKLEKPSEKEPVRYYAGADADLYNAILNMCATPGKMCMSEMMHIDMMGGGGKESAENREKLQYDTRHADEGIVAPAATVPATGAPARSEPAERTDGNSMQNDMPGMDMQHEGHSMPGMSNGADPAPAQLNNNN